MRKLLLIMGLFTLAIVACGRDTDDLAVQIMNLHDDVAKMADSFPDTINAIRVGTCDDVKALAEEADRLPPSGSPESLVRMAGLSLWDACEDFMSIVRNEIKLQERMESIFRDEPELLEEMPFGIALRQSYGVENGSPAEYGAAQHLVPH